MASFRAQQAKNRRKTMVLLGLLMCMLVVVVLACAYAIGIGTTLWVFPVAVGVAVVGVWVSYWSSDKLILKLTHARVVDHDTAPMIHNLVEEVAIASGLPMPKVALIDDTAPNAFATGRDPEHAVVALTTGLVAVMDREQLQGVVAHEMAHVANRDTLVSAVAATTAGLIAIVADLAIRVSIFTRRADSGPTQIVALAGLLVSAVLAPLAAVLLQSAISRRREALADATAVQFTRNPTGLRRALEELEGDSTVVATRTRSLAHLWIESPLEHSGMNRLFATHPPIRDRIDQLRELEGLPPSATADVPQ